MEGKKEDEKVNDAVRKGILHRVGKEGKWDCGRDGMQWKWCKPFL